MPKLIATHMHTSELGEGMVLLTGEGGRKMGIMNYTKTNDLHDPAIFPSFQYPLHNYLNLNLQVNRNLGS